MNIDEANLVVHPVETQWHYPILTGAGFVPETLTAVGFVRHYTYRHPSGTVIKCTTGVRADTWDDKGTGAHGYWADLQPHINSLSN